MKTIKIGFSGQGVSGGEGSKKYFFDSGKCTAYVEQERGIKNGCLHAGMATTPFPIKFCFAPRCCFPLKYLAAVLATC